MAEHFDRLETRAQQSRETLLFRDLRAILAVAKARAPSLRRQLKGVKLADVKSRTDLCKIPLLRTSDLQALQAEFRSFGGLSAMRPGGLKRWLVTDSLLAAPEGNARDWWGAARALHAAGLTPRDVALNCFSYVDAAQAFMMESGAETIGAAIIPAGCDDVERVLAIIERDKPTFYCGTLEFLRRLVDSADAAGRKIGSIERALVAGSMLPQATRTALAERNIIVRQVYAHCQLGIIAYETELADGSLSDGMVVNEHVIVEIIRPGTGAPAEAGDTGEVVVTRITPDYPLLRFAPGDFSALLPGVSPCGRTNLRIKGSLGRLDVSGATNVNSGWSEAPAYSLAAPMRLADRMKAMDSKPR